MTDTVRPFPADFTASSRCFSPMLLAIAAATPIPRPFPMPMRMVYIGYTMPNAARASPPSPETQRLSTMLLSCWKNRATPMGIARAMTPLR